MVVLGVPGRRKPFPVNQAATAKINLYPLQWNLKIKQSVQQWNPLIHSVIQTEAKPLLCIMLITSAPAWHIHTTRRMAEAGYTGRQKGYKCDMMIIYYHLPNIHLSTPQCPLQRWSINLKPLTLVLATWLTLVNKVCVDMAHATLEQRTIGLLPSAMRRRLLFQPRCHNGRLVVQAQRPEWRANWNLMHRLGRTAKQSIDPWAKLKQLMFYLSHQDFECVCPYSKKLTNKRDHIIYCPRLRYF